MNQELAPKAIYSVPTGWGENLDIKPTTNGWWIEKEKVFYAMAIFKMGGTVKQACEFIDISPDQYKYFVQLHPVFTEIRKRLQLFPQFKAQELIASMLGTDVKLAKWYLEKIDPRYMSASRLKVLAKYRGEKFLREYFDDLDE